MTVQSPSSLKTNEFQDGQAAGSITPSRVRDVIDTAAGAFATQQSGTTYTLALTDSGTTIETTSATAVTITVPTNATVAFPVGTVINFLQYGAGQITFSPASGVTLRTPSTLQTRAQYSVAQLRQRATNEWTVAGDLA